MSKSLENMSDEELMSFENPDSFENAEDVSEDIAEPDVQESGEIVEASGDTPEESENHDFVEEEEDVLDPGLDLDNDDNFSADHTTPKQEASAETVGEVEEKTEESEASSTDEVDYKAAYENMMAPFKANGKEFTPESPEEVIRLAQQGANYVKKMTALKPNLRMMRMLENNGLLDEQKLSFLIDLNSGDQEAIKKFLKEKSVDPMDLDVDEEPKYQPRNHTVSDQEITFSDTLQDVMSAEDGPKTVQTIQHQWDERSKEAVYADPSILPLIHEQRSNGVYGRITAEMDRRRTLGLLTDSTPFLEAYRNIGDELHAAGRLIPQAQAQAAPAPQTQPRQAVASRPGHSRTASAPNAAAARAASPARISTKQPKASFDPTSMTDDEIMAMDFSRI